MNISSFALTVHKLRDLESDLRSIGFSRRDSLKAVAIVRKWLLREAEVSVPVPTPSDLVVPDEIVHHP